MKPLLGRQSCAEAAEVAIQLGVRPRFEDRIADHLAVGVDVPDQPSAIHQDSADARCRVAEHESDLGEGLILEVVHLVVGRSESEIDAVRAERAAALLEHVEARNVAEVVEEHLECALAGEVDADREATNAALGLEHCDVFLDREVPRHRGRRGRVHLTACKGGRDRDQARERRGGNESGSERHRRLPSVGR